jgi:predicted Zn-dependent protease
MNTRCRSVSARLRLASLTAASAIVVACATNPATGKRELNLMSEAQEIALGKEADGQIRQEMGIVDNPALQQYVDRIARPLAQQSERPNLPWTFTVVDAPAVNAFALPGGYIYVTRGILAHLNSEAELAGVLATRSAM